MDTVIVVEDDALSLKLYCEILRAHGYEAIPVQDGNEVLATALAWRPALMILDIRLPNISGAELITRLRKEDSLKAMAILAISIYADQGDEKTYLSLGAAAFLPKPFPLPVLLDEVARLIRPKPAR